MLRRVIPLILLALLAGCAGSGDRSEIPQASVGSGGGGDWSRGGY